MRITFGIDLDGTTPQPGSTSLGDCICGPLGLLDLLEKQFGLSAPSPSVADRVIAASQALEAHFKSHPGYGHASYLKDPLAVADTLLAWRDELVLAGWNRRAFPTTSAKLQLIGLLDAGLDEAFCSSEGDRICDLLATLPQSRGLVEKLRVVDAKNHLPTLWQRLLDQLGAEYESAAPQFPEGCRDSDLHRFQQALRQGKSTLALKNDKSLQIVTAHSEWLLAQTAAQIAMSDPSALMVTGESAHLVDQTLGSQDQPKAGLESLSRGRAIPQVLSLALRLRWEPMDPQQMLEFLIHPVCPVGNPLRRYLAAALEEAPGFGGPRWREAIEAARQSVHRDGEHATERPKRINQDLAGWLEQPRYARGTSALGSELAVTTDLVCAWAGARGASGHLSSAEAALFFSLASSASQLSRALRTLKAVTEPELSRLLDHVLGTGCGAGDLEAELGHLRVARRPGAVRDSANVVLWWNAAEPAAQRPPVWSLGELGELAAAGIALRSDSAWQEREARCWAQPVFAAQERMLFFVPLQRAGDPVTRHPLISRLEALVGSENLPVWSVDEALTAGSASSLSLRPLKSLEIPRVRRWWRVGAGNLPLDRPSASFSSLEKFIYSPHQWVLHYLARLRPGTLGRRLNCDQRLFGILIHRLVEDLFNNPPPTGLDWLKAKPEEVKQWVDHRWPELLREEGAMLLLPGWRSTGARVQAEAVRAIQQLIHLLGTWGVAEAKADVTPAAKPFAGGELTGDIDLVVRNAANRRAVVDLKYGGRESKVAQVSEGRPLQLAVYARLLSEGGEPVPGAFYILADRRLLTRDGEFFKGATVVKSRSGSSDLAEVWREFEQVWQWRRAQLAEGWIELTIDGTDPTPANGAEPDSTPPLDHWTPPPKADQYSDFTTLTGFPANA